MNLLCECPLAGYCNRHQKMKGPEQHSRCNGTANTPDKGLSYWNAWEQGKAGATAPKDPQLNPPGFTDQSVIPHQVIYLSSVGDVLNEIVKKHGGIPCQDCINKIESLNSKTVEDCRKERQSTIDEMVLRSRTQAPKLWQRIGVMVDGVLHTGLTEKVIAGWVDEALDRGAEPKKVQPAEQKVKDALRAKAAEAAKIAPVGPARFSSSFKTGKEYPRFITSEQLQLDIKLLLSKIPPDITAIAGIARSGLSVATMLSMYLHLPMLTIRQTMNDIVDTGNGWRLGGSKHIDPKYDKVLIVDDTVMTGNSIKAIRPLVQSKIKNAIYSAVYVNPLALTKPDIWAVDLSWPHILEWNVFNSVLSPSIAVDFDGILCYDCPIGSDDDGPKYLDFIRNARPLYTPRKAQIPLIVTARIEKYRSETESWLKRNNIKWNKLIMHPANTLKEREADNIPAFKAKHYLEWAKNHKPSPGPIIFMESEDAQAREIFRLSNLMTICPSTAEVYK